MNYEYKAKLEGLEKYNENYTYNRKCVLPISIGNTNQEGAKLKATINTISKRFSCFDIIIADTLQRYNIMDKLSEDEASVIKRATGDLWEKENMPILKNITIPYRCFHWDTCIENDNFLYFFALIKKFYNENWLYRQSVDRDISFFLKRHGEYITDKMKNLCKAYILEETAVTLSFFVDQAYNYIIYPSKIPESISLIRKYFLSNKNPILIRDIKIYFRKYQKPPSAMDPT